MEPAITVVARHIECTLEEYHSMKDSYSHSQAEDLVKSPPLFHGRHILGVYPREKSEALDIGSIAHAAILEGSWEKVLAIIPAAALNAAGHRVGKAWQQWSAAHTDKIQMKEDEATAILHMVKHVYAHPFARKLLRSPGPIEHSLIWTDEETGLRLRARPDKIVLSPTSNGCIIPDVKTTRATTERDFRRDAVRFGYFRQAAWQWDGVVRAGWEPAGFVFVVVDKSPAHECTVFEVDEQDIAFARRQNRVIIKELARRLAENDWTGRNAGRIVPLSLPDWARKDNPWEVTE
jgi:hypothetical protein